MQDPNSPDDVSEQPAAGVTVTDEVALPRSRFRTVVVPVIALVMVGALIGLLAFALFAPEQARVRQGGRVNASGALVLEE
ncbi:MAG TPA: hypothetical protein PKA95_07490, partial [Thermomicrobiales bacterium]|nr:hypothetical protein [Thermomicrobiales bacterium]